MSTDILTEAQSADIRADFACQFYGESNNNAGIVHLYRMDSNHYLFGRASSKVIAEKEITNYAEIADAEIRREIHAFMSEFVHLNPAKAFYKGAVAESTSAAPKKYEFSYKQLLSFCPAPLDSFLLAGFGDAYMQKGRHCWDVYFRALDKDYLIASGDTRRHAIDLAMVWVTSAKKTAVKQIQSYIETGRSLDTATNLWPALKEYAIAYCDAAGIKAIPTYAVLPNRGLGWTSVRMAPESELPSLDFDEVQVGDQTTWGGGTATIVGKGTDREMRELAEGIDRAVASQLKFQEAIQAEKTAKAWKWTVKERLTNDLGQLAEGQTKALGYWNKVNNPLSC